jgi:hypothetical protein
MGGEKHLLTSLKTCFYNGIQGDKKDIEMRKKCFGVNNPPEPMIKGFSHHFIAQLKVPII